MRRNKLNAIARGILVIVVLFAAVVSVYAGKVIADGPVVVTVEKEKIIEKTVTEEPNISGETIQHEIRAIGELCTADYRFTHVETYDSIEYFFDTNIRIPGSKSNFIYSYDGNVKAGVDFSCMEVEKDDESGTITIVIPPARIISSSVDPESFSLYDEKNGIFNSNSVADFAYTFADLLKSEEERAMDEGLLVRAEDNARLLVENFMKAGYDIRNYSLVIICSQDEI